MLLIDKYKIPKSLDLRRMKLSLEDIEEIKRLRNLGKSASFIAQDYPVSATTILRITNPDYAQRQDEATKVRQHKYYDKSKQVERNNKSKNRRKKLFNKLTKEYDSSIKEK